MKPRSKKEMLHVGLAERLPAIGGEVEEWAKATLFEDSRVGYYSRRRRSVHCMCCGHDGEAYESPLANAIAYECPNCGRPLSVYKSHPRQEMHTEKWFYMVDVFEGRQVIRMFEASRWNEAPGVETRFGVRELWQRWLTPEGKEVITSRPYSRTYNSLHFRTWEPYGIAAHCYSCSGYYEFEDLFECKGAAMYPAVKISPLLRRNGCTVRNMKYMVKRGVDVVDFMKMILKNNIFETLLKVGQNALATYYVKQPSFNMRDYMHAVNICTRNKYRVKDADIWLDYIHMLIITGRDSHNAVYVCPADLKDAHDRILELLGACPHDHEENDTAVSVRAARYRAKMKMFEDVKMKAEDFSIAPIMTIAALRQEGEEMSHCVYRNKYDRKNSLILSVRKRTRQRERIATVEVGLDKFTILQCRGKNNTVPPHHAEIRELINRNMNMIRSCVNG